MPAVPYGGYRNPMMIIALAAEISLVCWSIGGLIPRTLLWDLFRNRYQGLTAFDFSRAMAVGMGSGKVRFLRIDQRPYYEFIS